MAHAVSQGQVTGSRRLGRLPAEAASFVGREAELAAVTALLASARMVTVTGPAGVGKTRTSQYAAARVSDRYRDGVWLADLGGVSDPRHVADAVADALGGPAVAGSSRLAALLAELRGQQLLLVLDTCEHLVDAAAAFADTVLRAAPGVTLLATSRQPLDAQGEHAFPLLPLPAEGADAVALLTQRAAAVVPGFAVTPRNRTDVLRLCRALDGLPLAIELAALRLRALPLAELASQLESGLRTLTVSRRGTSARQQTLRGAVDWSYRLCSPAERTLWERLSVFGESFDVAAAEQVCPDGTLTREQVLPALVGLVDKSVVLRDSAESPRYRLPAALREFGADQLAAAGEQEHFLDRLTAWALTVARDFDERFRSGTRRGARRTRGRSAHQDGHAVAFRRLEREYPNIRAALGWALRPDGGDRDGRQAGPSAVTAARWRRGADLAVRLSGYWQLTGRLDEGSEWLAQIAARFPETARERIWALGARGQLTALQGRHDEALADLGESIRLAVAAGRGAEAAAARGYLHLNLALTLAGQHGEALAAGQTARERLSACGHPAGLLALEAQLALLHQLAGEPGAAVACGDRGLALLADAGFAVPGPAGGVQFPGPGPLVPGRVLCLSGHLQLFTGLALADRPGGERAGAAALRRALTAKHELGDVVGTAFALDALGWLAARRGQYERAAWLLGAADQLWARTGRRLCGVAALAESREYATCVARQALGERRYASAYAYGAALSLDAAVSEAADAGAEPPEPPEPAEPPPPPAGGGETAVEAGHATALLTRREQEIAELVASGLSNREIAQRLFISKRTVDAHVDHIFGKLEISSRVQLTVLLREPGRDRAARN